MTDYRYFNAKSFSANMTDNMLIVLNNIIPKMLKTDEPVPSLLTGKALLCEMMNILEDEYRPKHSKQEDLDIIKKLTSEIKEQEKVISNFQNTKSDNEDNLKAAIKENELLKQNIREHTGKEPEKVTVYKEKDLSPTQILIEFSPLEHAVITFVSEQETARTRKTVTPQTILKDIFNLYVTNGACDFFPLPSAEQLKNIRLKFKTA